MNNRREFIAGLAALPLTAESDPWRASEILDPAQLAKDIGAQRSGTSILCVGFPVLYRAAHITNAALAGPCSKTEGLAALRAAVQKLSHEQALVLYCGCCPFDKCPNIRPAYTEVRKAGVSRVKVLYLPTNLHTDWIVKGYPIERPDVHGSVQG